MHKHAAAILLAVLPALALLSGCQNSLFKGTALEDTVIDQAPASTIDEITVLYESGDYQAAYDAARPVAWDRYRDDRFEAAYIAGLSAQSLGDLAEAEKMLKKTLRTEDQSLAADAAYALGLVYSQKGRYREAYTQLFRSADQLFGERKALATFYAGIAQQKLGQWSQARTTLVLAKSRSADPALRSQIDEQIQVTGWTLQLGAFTNRDRARKQAQSIAAKAQDMRLGLPRLVAGSTAEGDAVTLVHVGQFTSYQSATRYRDALGTPGVIIRAMKP